MEKNNLFRFATSELSQDAIICWCLNWFNDDRKPRLKEMAISLVKKMAGDITVSSVDIVRQFSERVKMDNGATIHVKVDVLAIINKKIGLIIEDKTTSDVHDDQIIRYIDGIKQILAKDENGLLRAEGKEYALDPKKLKTVYWKTGFFYDYDQVVSADIKIDAQETQALLSPYRGDSDILDDYICHLEQSIRWYNEHHFTKPHEPENGIPGYDWYCDLACEHYPQYCLMRILFPAERWENRIPDQKFELYQVYHGSSFGRPYTQMAVLRTVYSGTKDGYELFWRIDTDNNGPYISLRFYEWDLKKDNNSKERHNKQYGKFIAVLQDVISKESLPIPLEWKDIYPGFRGNYKESALLRLSLGSYLEKWKEQSEAFIQTIQSINDRFLKELSKAININ